MFDLPTLNQLDQIPKYGNNSRVKVSSAIGAWQEVEIKAFSLEELDTPEFWGFIDEAIKGFFKEVEQVETTVESHMPWTKLGQKWHFIKKGFAPGKKVLWKPEVLEQLYELLKKTAPDAQFLWSNKQMVHIYVPQQKEPWASILTKKNESLWIHLIGPSKSVPLERVNQLSKTASVSNAGPRTDVVRLAFNSVEEIQSADLANFLGEHLEMVCA